MLGKLVGLLCLVATASGAPFESNFEDDALVEVSGTNILPGAALFHETKDSLIQSSQAEVIPDSGEQSDEDGAVDAVVETEIPSMQLRKSLYPVSPSPIPMEYADEMKMPIVHAKSADGRDDMKPTSSTPFDADCDSPQIGESEPWPNRDKVDMNKLSDTMGNESHVEMVEQPDSSREFPLDKNSTRPSEDDPAALKGTETMQIEDFNQPEDQKESFVRTESLPAPPEQKTKNKCSRSLNAHDVPNPLELMDDDCGMPEPEIPCETAGNSTLCPHETIELEAPTVPPAELMPAPSSSPLPPAAPQLTNVSVEFVDFGTSSQVTTQLTNTVGRTIELAGAQFDVDAWAAQLIRNMGADIHPDTLIKDLEDRRQIVVYLRCAYDRHKSQLIADLPACEELLVQRLVARVEVPAYDSLYSVPVISSGLVGDVIGASEVEPDTIERITYDGQEVHLETTLEEIFFRNNSAFVVYPKEPCRSQSSTPSATPTGLPSFSPSPSITPFPSPSITPLPAVHKVRKLGAYDAFRHCRNANGEKPRPPPPEALGLDPANDPNGVATNSSYNCEESEMTEPEIVEYSPQPSPPAKPSARPLPPQRQPMTRDAKIMVEIDHRLIPVLIHPDAKGIDIFDAVKRATGREHEYMIGIFMNRKIDHYTRLKPFGLIDNDIVRVVSPTVPIDDTTTVGAFV